MLAVTLAGCSSASRDSDEDRLYDDVEKAGWAIHVDLMTERVERHVTTDPHKEDTDGDGLTDSAEFQLPGLDPTRKDTDGDGLTDCQEALHTVVSDCEDPAFGGPYDGGYDTNPAKADSDPGYSRYVNQVLGFTDHTGTLAGGVSETGDGISDGDEVRGYSITLASGARRFIHTSPLNGDVDDDGLEDGEELDYQSDATVPDTDGDGCVDGLDLVPERVESYSPGLGEFTLKRASAANVRVQVLLANHEAFTPDGGPLRMEQGQTVDLGPYQPTPGRSDKCTYAPYHAWVLVEVQAFDQATGGSVGLDVGSMTPAERNGPVVRLYWQVREGKLAWDPEGADAWDAQAGVQLDGADGRLFLRPTLS